MARRLIAATASAVLILGLAACDDGKGPVTTPPPDLGFEPQTSDGGGDESEASDGGGDDGARDGGGDGDSQAAPDIPAPDRADFPGMDKHTEEGAAQAFRYYIAMSMWGRKTGDDTVVSALEEDSCNACKQFNEEIRTARKTGIYWSDFDIEEVNLISEEGLTTEFEIGWAFTISDHSRPDPETGEKASYGPIDYITVGGMEWVDGEWHVALLTASWGKGKHG